jgi:hypothetical protein
MVENNDNPKQPTVSEMFNLSDRKITAIYDTVKESTKELTPVNAIKILKETFQNNPDELVFALYTYGMMVGYDKAVTKIGKIPESTNSRGSIPREVIPQLIDKCIKTGVHIAVEKFKALEAQGKITVNDPDFSSGGGTIVQIAIGIIDENGNMDNSGVPNNLIEELTRDMNLTPKTSQDKESQEKKKPAESDNSDDKNDHAMYG